MDKSKKIQALQAALLIIDGVNSFDLLTKYGINAFAINKAKKFIEELDNGN